MPNTQDHDPLFVEPIADDVAAMAKFNNQLSVAEGKVFDGATDLGVRCQYLYLVANGVLSAESSLSVLWGQKLIEPYSV